MMRWDIINHLIRENNYKSYLEIGYYKGWSFNNIICQDKTAVDPHPCKTPEQELMGELSVIGDIDGWIHKSTSDEFFGGLLPDFKWDIIFIDGLHESQQVDRDIQNALKHLSPGGTIVMHDCNPTSYEMTTTGTAAGEWTGDVYKSFIDFKWNPINETQYSCYVVDTDYGVGIIHEANKLWTMTRLSPLPSYITRKDYHLFPVFDANRKQLLHLVTPEDFIFIEGNRKAGKTNEQTTTDNNVPA